MRILLFVFLGLITSLPAQATYQIEYDPTLGISGRLVLGHLQRQHYKYVRIDDDFSSRVFDNMFDTLDSNHQYFYQSDIDEFKLYRINLDNAVIEGDFTPILEIYNRMLARVFERLDYASFLLEQPYEFNYKREEKIDLRRAITWHKDVASMNDHWRKLIKNELLSLMLEGDSLKDARATLAKQFNQRRREYMSMDADDMFQTFMNLIAAEFDPHTEFMSPAAQEDFDINLSLALEGIGAELHRNNDERIVVSRILPDGPAGQDGRLRVEDEIIAVDQNNSGVFTPVAGLQVEDVVRLIRGPADSIVKIKVARAASDQQVLEEIDIIRKKITLAEDGTTYEIIETKRGDKLVRVGVISIPSFYIDFDAWQAGDENYNSTSRDVAKILLELRKAQVDSILIDLRDNGGGSLREANVIAGFFIPAGPIVQVRLSNGYIELFRDNDFDTLYDGPLGILVNRMSASASEILAAALQDHGRALVMGDTTFGKGTVQTLTPLEYGQLKLTQAKFYRINGDSTQHKGVIPDIAFPSLYNFDETGESSLHNPLPWDTVESAFYTKTGVTTSLIERLSKFHLSRQNQTKDFSFANSLVQLELSFTDVEEESLHLVRRQKTYEQQHQMRMDLINGYRSYKGMAKAEDLDSFPETLEVLERSYLDAASEIMADWATTGPSQEIAEQGLGLN